MKENEDWLDEFHEGSRMLDDVIHNIGYTIRNLKYAFPHIAQDLERDMSAAKEASKKINSALNRNMNERISEHNKFVGSAISACLHLGDDE